MPANTQWIGRHSRIVRIEDPIRRQPAPWPRRPRGQLGLYRSQVARTNGLPGCTLLTLDDEASGTRPRHRGRLCRPNRVLARGTPPRRGLRAMAGNRRVHSNRALKQATPPGTWAAITRQRGLDTRVDVDLERENGPSVTCPGTAGAYTSLPRQ